MPCVCHNGEPHVETSEILVGGPRVSEGFEQVGFKFRLEYSHGANPGGIPFHHPTVQKRGEYLGSAFPVTCGIFFVKQTVGTSTNSK